jgi:hypothetical protein
MKCHHQGKPPILDQFYDSGRKIGQVMDMNQIRLKRIQVFTEFSFDLWINVDSGKAVKVTAKIVNTGNLKTFILRAKKSVIFPGRICPSAEYSYLMISVELPGQIIAVELGPSATFRQKALEDKEYPDR